MIGRRIILNNSGNDVDNAILEDLTFRITCHKQRGLTLRKAWVAVGQEVFYELTSSVVSSDESVYVDVTAGTEIDVGFPAKRNVIHFTFSDHARIKIIVYAVSQPDALIELDGYNCNDWEKPFIWPCYPEVG